MGDLTYFPGATAARRHLSSPLASAEQRRAAADHLRDTCPEDLLWAAPGTSPTSRLTDAELIEIMPPEQWRARKVEPVGIWRFIGAGLPTSTLFIGSIIFLMLISVQFSIKISRLTNQVKDLAQDNALLRGEVERLKKNA
jgi:hypothetical protein